VTRQRKLVLILTIDLPFLRRDLGMFAHAHAGRAVAHGGEIEFDIARFDLGDVCELMAQRACLLKLAQPVRQRLAETDLDAAQAVGTADQRKAPVSAIDHPGRLECADHACATGHNGREGGDRRCNARIHEYFPCDVAPRQIWHNVAPDDEVAGTERAIASKLSSRPSTFAKGVRRPAASQISTPVFECMAMPSLNNDDVHLKRHD
jgi:hypothetical protein